VSTAFPSDGAIGVQVPLGTGVSQSIASEPQARPEVSHLPKLDTLRRFLVSLQTLARNSASIMKRRRKRVRRPVPVLERPGPHTPRLGRHRGLPLQCLVGTGLGQRRMDRFRKQAIFHDRQWARAARQ